MRLRKSRSSFDARREHPPGSAGSWAGVAPPVSAERSVRGGTGALGALLTCIAAGAVAGVAAAQPQIIDLGVLPGATSASASAVSADGSTVVGSSGSRAFRWTKTEGMRDLGVLPGQSGSLARFVSDYGDVVVGTSGTRAFRWTASQGMQDLGMISVPPGWVPLAQPQAMSWDGSAVAGLVIPANASGGIVAFHWTLQGGMRDVSPGRFMYASGVSADGRTVFGASPGDTGAGYLWTVAGGIKDLRTLTGSPYVDPCAVSYDGSVVAGSTFVRAFRWSAASGMQEFGVLPGDTYAEATAMSENTSVIVGQSGNGDPDYPELHAFRWSAKRGTESIGLPGFEFSSPLAMDYYGSTIVGSSDNGDSRAAHAFLWTRALGTVDLNDYLPVRGADLNGHHLYSANGIARFSASIIAKSELNGASRALLITNVPLEPCLADFDRNFFVNGDDFDAFAIAYDQGMLAADIDGNGFVNGDDFDTFLPAFEAGC